MLKKIFKITGVLLILLMSTTFLLFLLQPRIPLGALSSPISVFLSYLTKHEQVISGRFYLVPGSWTTISVEECAVTLTGDENFHLKAKIDSARTSIHLWPLFAGKINLNNIFVKGVSLDLLTGEKKEKKTVPLSFPLEQAGDIELSDITITIRQQEDQSPIQFQLEKGVGGFSSETPGQLAIEAVLNGRKFSARLKGGPLQDIGKKKTTWSFSANLPHSSTSGQISLDFSSEVVKISTHLNSSSLNVGAILDELQLAEEITLELDTVITDLNSSGRTPAELLNNLAFTIKGAGGSYEFQAPNTEALFPISLHQATLTGIPGDKISFVAEGELDATPISIEMEFEDRRGEVPVSTKDIPFKNLVLVAGTSLELSGKISLPFTGTGTSLNCRLHGEQLSSLNDLLNLKLPDVGPYDVRGRLNIIPKGYQLDEIELQMGSSSLAGTILFDTEAVPPALAVDLHSPLIQLDDFKGIWMDADHVENNTEKPAQEQVNNTESEKQHQYLTDQRVIDSYNASLSISIKEVFSGEDYLGSGLLKIDQRDGRLSIAPLQVQFAKGSAQIDFSLEPAGEERRYHLNISIDDLDYGFIGRWFDLDSDMEGLFSLRTSLQSVSPDFQSIMTNGSGSINFLLQPEQQLAGIIDIWAVSLLNSLTKFLDPKEESKINCTAGRFILNDGILTSDALIIDTSRIRINGNLVVDLKNQRIEGRFRPRPKQPQFFSLATPVQISGPLSDLKAGIPVGGGVGTLIRLATSYVVVPLQWIASNKLPKDGTADCLQLMEPKKLKERPSGNDWYSSP